MSSISVTKCVVSAFVFSISLIFSMKAHAFQVTCDCYGCIGENCSKLSELKELSLCRGPAASCGGELGYFRIDKVKVTSSSTDYNEVIELLERECAKQAASVSSTPVDQSAIEERTCIQRF